MAKEGTPFVIGFFVFCVMFVLLAYFTSSTILGVIAGLFLILTLFTIYFFRDPDRTVPPDENAIVSPSDGRVVAIQPYSDSYVGKKAVRVSVFLNIFNVHVNRSPCDGIVMNSKYKPGKFLPAFDPKTSEENEQTIIDIKHKDFKLRMKQIAGLIARRIVNHLRPGDHVTRGDRFGLIRFGSRMDIIFPADVEVKVELKQKVFGGKTVIGEWREV